MTELILIRHGQSIRNAGDTVQGSDPDPANTLSEKGEEQARTLGVLLMQRGVRPARAAFSPLVRARQTCDIALGVMGYGNLPVYEDARLGEICKGRKGLPGGLEGRKSIVVKTPEYREQYRQGGWDFRHGSLQSGGETARETGTRFLAALNTFADTLADGQTGLVFAHSQSIRFGLGAALGFPDIQPLHAEYKLNNSDGVMATRDSEMQWHVLGRLGTDPPPQ